MVEKDYSDYQILRDAIRRVVKKDEDWKKKSSNIIAAFTETEEQIHDGSLVDLSEFLSWFESNRTRQVPYQF